MRMLCALFFAVGMVAGPSVAAEDVASRRAKLLSEEAAKQFDLGEFDMALQSYKEAYLNRPDPVFLFNIGQCHRRKGDYEEAAAAYRSYLRKKPDAPNREAVEQLIAETERAVAQKKAPPAGTLSTTESRVTTSTHSAQSMEPTPPRVAMTATQPAPPREPHKKKWWVLGASIGAAVVVGVAVGLGVGLGAGGGDAPAHPGAPSLSLSF